MVAEGVGPLLEEEAGDVGPPPVDRPGVPAHERPRPVVPAPDVAVPAVVDGRALRRLRVPDHEAGELDARPARQAHRRLHQAVDHQAVDVLGLGPRGAVLLDLLESFDPSGDERPLDGDQQRLDVDQGHLPVVPGAAPHVVAEVAGQRVVLTLEQLAPAGQDPAGQRPPLLGAEHGVDRPYRSPVDTTEPVRIAVVFLWLHLLVQQKLPRRLRHVLLALERKQGAEASLALRDPPELLQSHPLPESLEHGDDPAGGVVVVDQRAVVIGCVRHLPY